MSTKKRKKTATRTARKRTAKPRKRANPTKRRKKSVGRLLKSTKIGKATIALRRNTEWNEYVVEATGAGRANGTFHTQDKRDAEDTYGLMVAQLRLAAEPRKNPGSWGRRDKQSRITTKAGRRLKPPRGVPRSQAARWLATVPKEGTRSRVEVRKYKGKRQFLTEESAQWMVSRTPIVRRGRGLSGVKATRIAKQASGGGYKPFQNPIGWILPGAAAKPAMRRRARR